MRKLAFGLAVAAAAAGWGTAAKAGPMLTLTLQESGSGEFLTTSSNGSISFAGPYGTFDSNVVGGLGSPLEPSPDLSLTSLNFTSVQGGTLTVTLTESGLTLPLGPLEFTSGFSSNTTTGTVKSVETTSLNGVQLATDTFTGTGALSSNFVNFADTGTGPYTESEVVVITAQPGSAANDTVSMTVDEPASAAMFAAGLLSLGLIGLRRRA